MRAFALCLALFPGQVLAEGLESLSPTYNYKIVEDSLVMSSCNDKKKGAVSSFFEVTWVAPQDNMVEFTYDLDLCLRFMGSVHSDGVMPIPSFLLSFQDREGFAIGEVRVQEGAITTSRGSKIDVSFQRMADLNEKIQGRDLVVQHFSLGWEEIPAPPEGSQDAYPFKKVDLYFLSPEDFDSLRGIYSLDEDLPLYGLALEKYVPLVKRDVKFKAVINNITLP